MPPAASCCVLSCILSPVQSAQVCNDVPPLADARWACDSFRWCASRRAHQAIAAALQRLNHSPTSLPEWMAVSWQQALLLRALQHCTLRQTKSQRCFSCMRSRHSFLLCTVILSMLRLCSGRPSRWGRNCISVGDDLDTQRSLCSMANLAAGVPVPGSIGRRD